MPEFVITRWVCGSSPEILIDQERYDRVCKAKDGILLSTELEERLAVVLENYVEYEVEVFSHGLRWVVHEDWRWESRRDQVFALNRRLLAFLNATCMYFDHADGELKRRRSVPKDLEVPLRERLKLTILSEPVLALQLLRNYCQHQQFGFEGVRVTNSRYKMQRTLPRSAAEERTITSAALAVKVSELKVGRRHPTRQILEKLRRLKIEEWNPGPDLRKAIDSLTLFHSELREALEDMAREWYAEIKVVLEEAQGAFGDTTGLCVARRMSRGVYEEHVEIFSDFLARAEELRKRNGDKTSLENSIVTSSIPIEPAPNKSLQRTREERR